MRSRGNQQECYILTFQNGKPGDAVKSWSNNKQKFKYIVLKGVTVTKRGIKNSDITVKMGMGVREPSDRKPHLLQQVICGNVWDGKSRNDGISKAHCSLVGDTRLFSNQLIISTISIVTINLKGSCSPHPNSFLAPVCKMSLLKNGEKMWILGFYHSTLFLIENFLIAEFGIWIQQRLTISHQ